MKRSLEISEIHSPSKKMKIHKRESLFSLFEKNDVDGFRREAEWRNLYDKKSLNEKKKETGEYIFFVAGESKKTTANRFFKILVDNGVSINTPHPISGMTELSSAAIDFSIQRIERALDLGADSNLALADGVSPLVYLAAKQDIKLYPKRFNLIDRLCAQQDVVKKDKYGRNIMHTRMLPRLIAERLLLNGADIDVLNGEQKKPVHTCWDPETRELVVSRDVVRKEVIMPAIELMIVSKGFNNEDNFPGMGKNIAQLVFNRQVVGRKHLNIHNLRRVAR